MLAKYPDELQCDLAETYRIYNWKALPVRTVATLSCGLRENSRVMRAMSGQKQTTDTMLLAAAVDRLSLLVWFQTKDGQKNRKRPPSLTEELTKDRSKEEKPMLFDTPEAFDEARQRAMKKGLNHG